MIIQCCCEKCGTLKYISVKNGKVIAYVPEQRSYCKVHISAWKDRITGGQYFETIMQLYQNLRSVKAVAASFGIGVISFMTIFNDLRIARFPLRKHGGYRKEDAYKAE